MLGANKTTNRKISTCAFVAIVCFVLCAVLAAVLIAKRLPSPALSVFAGETPLILEFTSKNCPPCVAMRQALEDLQKEYKSTLRVAFIDVDQQPGMARQMNIRILPTVLFISPEGKMLFRHEGFMPAAAIVMQFRHLGCDLHK